MAGIGPIRQDWEPVVVRKKAPTAAAKKDEKAVNAARRSGAEIDTMKKCEWRPSSRLTPPPFPRIDLGTSSELVVQSLGFRFRPFCCRSWCWTCQIRRLGFRFFVLFFDVFVHLCGGWGFPCFCQLGFVEDSIGAIDLLHWWLPMGFLLLYFSSSINL